jgi:hypothetical protein
VILEGRCAKGNPGILDGSHRLKLTDIWAPVGVDEEGSVSGRGAEMSRGMSSEGSLVTDSEGKGAGKSL